MRRALASTLAVTVLSILATFTASTPSYARDTILPVATSLVYAGPLLIHAGQTPPEKLGITSVKVRPGQTLSTIAKAEYGTSRDWQALWWVNRKKIRDPDAIRAGQVLKLSDWHPDPPRWLSRAARNAAAPAPGPEVHAASVQRTAPPAPGGPGTYSFAGLEQLWKAAGGPSWAASAAASVAECESGGRVSAYNPSGATGLWQILGSVVAGSLTDPMVNARNAVSKFEASGDTWAQWVCQPGGTTAATTAVQLTRVRLRIRLWRSALSRHYDWYSWGAAGPSRFDCSGLVYWAANRHGITLPRTTYAMIGSYHLVRTYHPRTGNLAFFGTGHVEFYDKPGWTYGAQQSGTRVGYHHYGGGWHPTSYWRVVRTR